MDVKSLVKDIYPLTPIQEGILYNYLLQKNSSAYFIQFEIVISSDLNIQLLEKSLAFIVRKYDVLRTNIVYKGIKAPKQVISQEKQININYQDISDKEPDLIKSYIKDWQERDKKRGFDLTRENLTRMNIFKTGAMEFVIVWSFHHIIVDGWSGSKIVVDFFNIYKSLLQNNYYLPDVKEADPYKNYVRWLANQNKSTALSYWNHYLKDYDTFCEIPRDHFNRNSQKQFALKEYMAKIDEQTTGKLSKIASGSHVTLNALVQTIWGLLLQRYNNSHDIVFGYVESVRPAEVDGAEDMVGVFMNTIPFRVICKEDEIFIELLKTIQQKILDFKKYGFLSLAEIQESSCLKNSLINHISVFQNYPLVDSIINPELLGIDIQDMHLFSHSNYDFSIAFIPGTELRLLIKYNGFTYGEEDVKRIVIHLANIMKSVIQNPGVKVSDIDIMDDREKDLIINSFNKLQSGYQYPRHKTICELFEEQVTINPDEIAVQDGSTQLTYRQLNNKANQLGNYLKEKFQIRPNDLIGVLLDNSKEAIITILGILKSGGAYVPIDPDYPAERIWYIIEDAGLKLMISNEKSQNKADSQNVSIVNIGNLNRLSANTDDMATTSGPNDLVYVIYTSGSMGKPKGVMIEQKGLVNYIYWAKNFYLQEEEINFPLYSSLSFDLTVTSIFTPLISGNRIIVYNDKNYDVLRTIFNDDKIGIIKLTPTHLRMLNLLKFENKNLKKIIVGGEDLKTETAQMIMKKFKHTVDIYNEYGPTETVVGCTVYKFDPEDNEHTSVLIGKPVANAYAYVMDPYNRIVPVGVHGELCIGGDGVARGYLHNEELNGQKFIDNPYKPGERIYKTGDSARWLPDGNLEFSGRLDEQVKIRGFRIELGEIEKVLHNHPQMNEAVVTVKEINNEQELVAYLVLNGNIEDADLVSYMEKFLPYFMIPTYMVRLQSIPLTHNGKVDKKTLPAPDDRNLDAGTEAISPQDETETALLEIWKDILGRENIGVMENFFSIGGHSLKVTELVARIQQTFHLTLSFETIFNGPTIREIAAYIIENLDETESVMRKIPPVEQREYYPVSYQQRGVYLASQSIKLFNIPIIIKIEGKLDVNRLEYSLQELIRRHESLRTSFHVIKSEIVQKVHESVEFQIIHLEGDEREIENNARNIITPFNLVEAPLVKVGLMNLEDERYVLICSMHHIIADAISQQILKDDLIKIYQKKYLPELKIQYKDYAVWHNHLVDDVLKSESEYWKSIYMNNMPDLHIPTDFPGSGRNDIEGDKVTFKIKKKITFELKQIAIQNDSTLSMVLLSIYAILLAKYTKGKDIVIGSGGPGRSNPELNNIVGLFINPIPLRFQINKQDSFNEFLIQNKEHIIRSFSNALYPFEKIEQTLLKHSVNNNSLIKTVFELDLFDQRSEFMCGKNRLIPLEPNEIVAHKDLILYANTVEGELNYDFVYCKNKFKKTTINKLIDAYKDIADHICKNPDIMLGDLIISMNEGKSERRGGLSIEFNI